MELTLKIPCTKQEIAAETKRLRKEIKIRRSEIETLQMAVKHYQSQCDHEGQKTGCNQRDGNWGNPCPTCGYSY